MLETRELIIQYENEPIELLSTTPASKLIKKVKKRGQRKRITRNKNNNGKGKESETIITDLSAPYILDEKDNISSSDSDDDEKLNAFLKSEAELRRKTYEKHEKIIEEENEKRSQALLKREKILKNIETKINKNKKNRKTRSRQSTEPIEIPDNDVNINTIEIGDSINVHQEDSMLSPNSNKKRLLKLSEMNIIPDEDDNYDEENNNEIQISSKNHDLSSIEDKNQNIGIAFESDSESDSEFEFKVKSLKESLDNEKKEIIPPSLEHINNNTTNIVDDIISENHINENIIDIDPNKRKIDEINDIKELENDIENIQINNKKRKKMLVVESDSESD